MIGNTYFGFKNECNCLELLDFESSLYFGKTKVVCEMIDKLENDYEQRNLHWNAYARKNKQCKAMHNSKLLADF